MTSMFGKWLLEQLNGKNSFMRATAHIPKLTELSLFRWLIVVNIVLLTLAGLFYSGYFSFVIDPISYLGGAASTTGVDNSTSMYIYGLDMALSGLIMILLAMTSRVSDTEGIERYKALAYLLCGIGFLIASVSPDDTLHRYHVLGSSIAVAMLWILATTGISLKSNALTTRHYLLLQAVLQIPVLTYAGLFFARIEPLASTIQKPALLGIMVILIYNAMSIESSVTEEEYEAQTQTISAHASK